MAQNIGRDQRSHQNMAILASLLVSAFIFSACSKGNALSSNHYEKTCPNAEQAIGKVVSDATARDKTIPAALLRMHFHDCFIRGCDASVLLNSDGQNKAEKDAGPNGSLHAFFVIDDAKEAVEALCPGTVSCADILAIAARDAVVLSGGPYWVVPQGRKDGRVSRASETIQLPAPTFNINQLQQNFSERGLSTEDLVALLGAHTIGFSHCSSFENRLHNFNATHDMDPTLRPSFAENLKNICPKGPKPRNAGTFMDPSSRTFDNTYYKLVLQQKSLFGTDQALLTRPKTRNLVSKYASSKQAFYKAFTHSIIKMSSLTGGQEIRRHCWLVN